MSVDRRLAATTALYYADEYRDREEVGSSQRQQLAEAQVHATLALADEQRTANLIALAALYDTNANQGPIRALVRERLGLDES